MEQTLTDKYWLQLHASTTAEGVTQVTRYEDSDLRSNLHKQRVKLITI